MFKMRLDGVGEFTIAKFGEKLDMAFGSAHEFFVEEDAKSFANAVDFTKLLVVNDQRFYLNTKPEKNLIKDHDNPAVYYNDEFEEMDTRGIVTQGGDETRMHSVLSKLIPEFGKKERDYNMQLVHFDMGHLASYCNDCMWNRQCWTSGCTGHKCNWNAGYKCCKNEYGSSCRR